MAIAKKYQDPNGIWEVTTEADEMGWSFRTLGVFNGRIDEIAFALADKSYYSLTFRRVDPDLPVPAKPMNAVSVKLDSESGILNLTSKERTYFFKTLLRGADVTVSEGQFDGSIWLNKRSPEDAIRAAALAKLTVEEKVVLGLV